MKKANKWMTIALGGLVTVTVASFAIVWSGNRTEDNPDSGLESSNGPGVDLSTEGWLEGEDDPVGNENETNVPETENVLQETPENDQVLQESKEEPDTQRPVIQTPVIQAPETEPVGEKPAPEPETEDAAPAVGGQILSLNFGVGETIAWPVEGNVIQYYSMDTTVYFPTLKQYKCSPAIEIQSEAGAPVVAPANAKIVEIGEDVKIGRYIRMEIGGDYQILLGQLDELHVNEGDYIARGTQIGTLAAPTRYYVVEGDNLYFQMIRGEETVDPLDYLE